MSWLLIDISNSYAKIALGDRDKLGEWLLRVPTASLSLNVLDTLLRTDLSGVHFTAAAICSVVPAKLEVVKSFLRDRCEIHVLGCRSPLSFQLDVTEPEKVGADRLANVEAVTVGGRLPAIVIDFGTAITFDAVNENRVFCGGVIAPGLRTLSKSLAVFTSQLPEIDIKIPTSAIGKTTEAALQSGVVLGFRGLTREIISMLRQEFNLAANIVATGGDAEFAASLLPEIKIVEPKLTLQGLRLVASRVFSE